jgi:hypothetical protein
MMHRILLSLALGAAIVIGAASLGAEEPTPRIEDLGWMAGRWAGTAGGIEMEEYWIEPKGGIMLGVHRDTESGELAFFEYLRIEEREGKIVYLASPKGGAPTRFTLTRLDEAHAVFENPEHDFPQRIIYHLRDGVMTSRIEGTLDGELRSSEWKWSRIP